jgi:hypothetical protein
MSPSPFAAILDDFVRRVPGAFAAALVDREGETVDYVGSVDPFEIKVAAAEWRIAIEQAREQPTFATIQSIILRGDRQSFFTYVLPDAYALVLALRRRGGFTPLTRPLAVCERALAIEADWPRRVLPRWYPVGVQTDERRRPTLVHATSGKSHGLVVLGGVVGLRRKERGWRVRLDTGEEMTLVREPGDFWYSDADTS